ncbi:hypothetical protein WCX49_11640 [Sulfurimonas sp. HSL-1656]|uniref:hypothetical protein n=1 Tax=Thiomicrolovo subterrani TaxID=3131934 RepID=UPI0031F7F8CF
MNKLTILLLKALRRIYLSLKNLCYPNTLSNCERDPETATTLIYNTLRADAPCMIARFGGFELASIVNYIGVSQGKKNFIKYIKGDEGDWEWNYSLISSMNTNAGFFPPEIEKVERFCQLMLNDMLEVDILGSWLADEKKIENHMGSVTKVYLLLLDPYWVKEPWTRALEGKNILVVHPFKNTIESQYEKREFLFQNKGILPKFKSLTVIKAVQSLGGENTEFRDWFEALDFMKAEIDKVDYDICLIGAGAYGFPLAAHVKRQGKKAVHLGGSLQLLFGIKGKRWEDPTYNPTYNYSSLMNEYWVRPSEEETPTKSSNIESGCYW